MAKYTVVFEVDNTAPYDFSDVGLTPYVLSVDWSLGGRYKTGWQRDGDLTLTLDNSDGEFNPFDSGAMFYEQLDTRRRIRMKINGTVMWSGRIETVEPSLDRKKPVVTLTATQGVQDIKDIKLFRPFYQLVDAPELLTSLFTDNLYISYDVTPVFIVGYSEVGDNLTADYSGSVINVLFSGVIYA
jgi:hypothetical protein